MRFQVLFMISLALLLPLSCQRNDNKSAIPSAEVVRITELDHGSNVTDILLDSASLQSSQAVRIFVPSFHNKSLPVVYLLHGQTENEKMWSTLGFFRMADEQMREGTIQPMILVTPDIDNSFGVNNEKTEMVQIPNGMQVEYTGNNYEDFLIEDLIPYIDENYKTQNDRTGRYIGGISMGGFAAIHCALRHPEKFSRVGGHSPALINDPDFSWLYPTEEIFENRNPLKLAEKADLSGLEILLDVGEQDEYQLLDPVNELYQLLEDRGAAVQLDTITGGHNSSYWKKQFPLYLQFYSEGLQ